MVMIACFSIIEGLVAIINDDFFVVARHYTFDLDTSGWGWIHLVLGVLCCWSASASWPGARGRWPWGSCWPC